MIGLQILNYRIEQLLGEGGMGSVYLASNINIQQKVAIKVLKPELAANESIINRFRREATTLAKLDHQNIVKFLNFYEDEKGIFLIMEYIQGRTLEDYINKESGPIPEAKALSFFKGILDGFSYAHKHGVIHRDIKPANIVVTADDGIKILDFGIARIINESLPTITKIGGRVGTAMYMSPEQVLSKDVDVRSDIYSLGILLHQMVTGQAPYNAHTTSEYNIQTKIVEEKLPPAKTFYPFVSDAVQSVIYKAVEKSPEKRFQNCEAFKEELIEAIDPKPVVKAKIPPLYKWISIASLVIVLFAGAWIWDYNRTKVEYYKDYAEFWGIPSGIYELSSNQVAHRENSYRFEYKQRKLRRMTLVNSADQIREHHDSEHMEHPDDMKLFYNDDGNLDYIEYYDRNGKVLYKKDYNQKLNVVIFKHADEFDTEFALAGRTSETFNNPFANKSNKRSQISRYLLTYDSKGLVTEIQYATYQNVKVCDMDGIFGRRYVHDEKGRITEFIFIGHSGEPKNNKNGMGIKLYKYDENDDWISVSYHDRDKNPNHDDGNIFECKLFYDEYGNRIKEEYYNPEGELTYRTDMYVAAIGYTIDENGFRTEYRYYGLDGKPCVSNFGIASLKSTFDEMGNEISRSFFNLENEPMFSTDGNASQKTVYDSKGSPIEIWYYDTEDKLCFINLGIAGYKIVRDTIGNIIELRTCGTDKELCLQKDGTAGYNGKYDERSNLTEYTAIGLDNKPVICDNGYAIWRAEFDKRGNQTKLAFFDENNKPCLSTDEISGWNSEYDERGNEIKRSFFCIENQSCNGNVGYAAWTSVYDEQGNCTETNYYDEFGKIAETPDGYAGWKAKFDERGNQIESYYVDTKGDYAKNYLITKSKFDEHDNEIEQSLYDEKGVLAPNNKGYAMWTAEYDKHNNVLKKSFFNKNKELDIIKVGYAYYTAVYNETGNQTEIRFFDKNNQPANSTEYSAPMVKREYDFMGNVIYEGYFKHDGKTPVEGNNDVHYVDAKYDRFGRLECLTGFDQDGKFTPYSNGCGRKRMKYDTRGNQIEVSYHDQDDNLVVCDLGFAIQKNEFDLKGQITSESYFGMDKAETLNKEGYHKLEKVYDERGNSIEERYYVLENKLRSGMFAIQKNEYDGTNKILKITFFNANNTACNYSSEYPYAKILFKYKQNGDFQYREFYMLDGTLLGTLDANGNRIYTATEVNTYLKSLGTPFELGGGWYFTSATYDNYGTVTFLWTYSETNLKNDEIASLKTILQQFIPSYPPAANVLAMNKSLTVIAVDKAKRTLFTLRY